MTKTEFSRNLCRVKVYFFAEKEMKVFKTNVCVQKYSTSRILHFIQGAGMRDYKGCTKDQICSKWMGH
jgi:hypothetical protein